MRKTKVIVWRQQLSLGPNWYWTLRAPNGKVIGASSEGYRSRRRCIANFVRVTRYNITRIVPKRGTFTRALPNFERGLA